MPENYENYHKDDVRHFYRYKNPDGTYLQATDAKTLKSHDQIVKLTADEVKRMTNLGYIVEPFEPKKFNSFMDLSQTRHDKGLDE